MNTEITKTLSETEIPKVAHIIWFGKQMYGRHLNRFIKNADSNPDYSFVLWRDHIGDDEKLLIKAGYDVRNYNDLYDDLLSDASLSKEYKDTISLAREIIEAELSSNLGNPAAASDIFRLLLLLRGGFYFDTDIDKIKINKHESPVAPEFSLLIDIEEISARGETAKVFMNCAIGTMSNNPIIFEYLTLIINNYRKPSTLTPYSGKSILERLNEPKISRNASIVDLSTMGSKSLRRCEIINNSGPGALFDTLTTSCEFPVSKKILPYGLRQHDCDSGVTEEVFDMRSFMSYDNTSENSWLKKLDDADELSKFREYMKGKCRVSDGLDSECEMKKYIKFNIFSNPEVHGNFIKNEDSPHVTPSRY